MNSRYAPEEVSEFYGVDLDGILTPDLPREWYDQPGCLEAVLKIRDELACEASLSGTGADMAIVTGRPDTDFERTRHWLDRNGCSSFPLFCRDPKKFGHSADEAARFKAQVIREQGISTYYESELEQAVVIAELCPVADVIWWRKDKQVRISADRVASLVRPRELETVGAKTARDRALPRPIGRD